jgi:uncharacterized membrane protein HdeD (DUF308 family)
MLPPRLEGARADLERRLPPPSWGWSVASGLVSIALGVMLAMQRSDASVWFIGVAVGTDLILYGVALLMSAAAVNKLTVDRARNH